MNADQRHARAVDVPKPPESEPRPAGSSFFIHRTIDTIQFLTGRRVELLVASHREGDAPGLRIECFAPDGRRFSLPVPPALVPRFAAAVAAAAREIKDEQRRRPARPQRVAPLSPAASYVPGVPTGNKRVAP